MNWTDIQQLNMYSHPQILIWNFVWSSSPTPSNVELPYQGASSIKLIHSEQDNRFVQWNDRTASTHNIAKPKCQSHRLTRNTFLNPWNLSQSSCAYNTNAESLMRSMIANINCKEEGTSVVSLVETTKFVLHQLEPSGEHHT